MTRKRGRPCTARLRRMHLADWIDEVAEEYRKPGRQRGHVKQAIHELYDMRYGDWSAEDVVATGKEKPCDIHSFLKTIKPS